MDILGKLLSVVKSLFGGSEEFPTENPLDVKSEDEDLPEQITSCGAEPIVRHPSNEPRRQGRW